MVAILLSTSALMAAIVERSPTLGAEPEPPPEPGTEPEPTPRAELSTIKSSFVTKTSCPPSVFTEGVPWAATRAAAQAKVDRNIPNIIIFSDFARSCAQFSVPTIFMVFDGVPRGGKNSFAPVPTNMQ